MDDREEVIDILKMRFVNICPNKGLKIYGIPNASLKEFKNNNRKSVYENDPDERYRLKDEEIQA
jgi:hypothetical protein